MGRAFRRDMALSLFEHFVVCGRLVLVIVWLHVILPHRKIFKLIPHQDAPQVRVAFKNDAEQVEGLPLLKLRASPYRRERRHTSLPGPISRS